MCKKVCVEHVQASGIPRRVVAFVGGIDLCDGRFDTHDHPIFRTLQLEHKKDFYNDCIAGVDGEAGGGSQVSRCSSVKFIVTCRVAVASSTKEGKCAKQEGYLVVVPMETSCAETPVNVS